MPKPTHVPPELAHLIEKRQNEEDRRALAERREEDLGTLGAIETAESLDEIPSAERRSGKQRRQRRRRETD